MSTWVGFSERSRNLVVHGDPGELASSGMRAVAIGGEKSTSFPEFQSEGFTERCAATEGDGYSGCDCQA